VRSFALLGFAGTSFFVNKNLTSLIVWRVMVTCLRLPSKAWVSALLLSCAVQGAFAQPLLPALTQATSVDAALTAVGASKAQPNSRIAVAFEDIALPGPLKIEARSAIPGTAAMVLMVGAPAGWYGSNVPGETSPRPSVPKLGAAASVAAPAVLLAWQVPPGKKPVLRTTYPQLQQRQAFTLLVLAQGKWFYAVREAKLACEPPGCKRLRPMAPLSTSTP
jgi:hypothetical protein